MREPNNGYAYARWRATRPRGEEFRVVALLWFLVAWANAPFAIACGLVGVFALLQVTGVLGIIAGGGDAGDGVHHFDADHDLDADADADADGDGDGDGDAHDAGGQGRGLGAALLGAFGMGKIPMSLAAETFGLVFGLTGFSLNLRFLALGAVPPPVTLLWTTPLSLVAGYAAVAVVARIVGPILSSREHEATGRAELVGQVGVVISSRVDHDFGEVRIRDRSGHDVQLICKLSRASARPATERESVVVVDYDEARGELLVEPLDEEPRREEPPRKAI
jgi:membrane protein implicated in regulation of membrane protease activity